MQKGEKCGVEKVGASQWMREAMDGVVDAVRTGSPPNPNSGCPEIQPNTTNSGGPNNQYTKV